MNRSTKVRVRMMIGATVLLAAPVALASGLPTVPTFTGPGSKKDFKSKPAMIIYAGDGSGFLAGARKSGSKTGPLSWTSWTSSTGKGSGLNWLDNCKPSCAAGTFHSYPVNLKVSRPETLGGHLIFTRMTVTYTGKRPPHVSKSPQIWKVKYHKKIFIWVFPSQ